MKKVSQWLADWGFLYYMAWLLILLSPIWFPIYLARKLNNWVKK